jgi:hypothetical protein
MNKSNCLQQRFPIAPHATESLVLEARLSVASLEGRKQAYSPMKFNRIYSLLNYRTEGYVEMSDSQHMCGGA